MKFIWLLLSKLHYRHGMLPMETERVVEIIASVTEGDFFHGSFPAMVTAGTVGVAASAGLLLLSNRKR